MFGLFKKLDRIIFLLERLVFLKTPKSGNSITEIETIRKPKRKRNFYGRRSQILNTVAPEELRTKLFNIRRKNLLYQQTVAIKIGKDISQVAISAFERGAKISKMDFLAIVDFIEHHND